MISDPTSDMLTRIRNGYLAKKEEVVVPYSRFKEEISHLLVSLKYLEKVEKVQEDNGRENLKINLRYKGGVPAVTAIDRVSKPSLRIYRRNDHLPKVLSGMGQAIISTSQGLMTSSEARKKKLGGEVILRVY